MASIYSLTPREHELLALAARPMSAKEIAHETGLSLGTVNNYLSSAQRRLGVQSRTQAIRIFRAQSEVHGDKLHMNFSPVHEASGSRACSAAELVMSEAAAFQGVADSWVPRSRTSMEAFLGSSSAGRLQLPDPGSLSWQHRLCAIVALTIGIAFTLAAVVILLDALTRLTTL
jgi:DNA-binding CsgD family transcriptional regulator